MESIFLQILNMSITGSYIILAVMVLRLFLKKAPKKYSYLMWTVCAFRLCCPISFRNIFSIFNLRLFSMPSNSGTSLEHIPKNIGMMQIPEVSTGLNSIDNAVNSSLPAAVPEASANPMQIIIFIAGTVWLTGIVLLLLYSIISYIALHIRLKNAILYRENIYQSDKVHSPFVFGLINPKIYIPFNLDNTTMTYAIAHERYHIKRRDYIIKPIAFLILVLHWFNPLCWLAFILMSCDMEMSCDERVLSNGKSISKEYSNSLLSSVTNKRPPLPCPLAFGETGIRGRIKNILKYKKPKIYVSVISVILCAAAIIACASNPKNDSHNISYDNLQMSDDALTAFCGNIVGSMMADIDYADSEKIVFHYNNAIFVYNHQTAAMEKCFDLNNLNCAKFQQGDYGAALSVSADGKEALLVNYGSNDDIKDFHNYLINLENGSAAETNKTELSNPFSSFGETYTNVPDAKGWTSVRCAVVNDKTWYLTCEGFIVGTMKLCLYESGKTVSENFIFDYNNFNPRDIYNLADAQLIVGHNSYSLLDKSNLTELEKMLSNAEEIKGSGCPFNAVLKMTRNDGKTGVGLLASDSCAIYLSDGGYYDYSDGDNSRLLSLFGVDADTLINAWNYPALLYSQAENYLQEEFMRVYSPYYDIQSLEISNWVENGNEATFFYKMTYYNYNRDPDKAEYIQEAKERDQKEYETLYNDYLAPKESNYEFKIVCGENHELHLYSNAAPKGTDWQPIKIDDYIKSE